MRKKYIPTLAGAVVAVSLVIALLFVPVTYQLTIGSVVTIKSPVLSSISDEQIEAIKNLDSVINTNLAEDCIYVAFEDMKGKRAEADISEFLNQNHLLEDYTISSRDIVGEFGGNALAAITGGNITVNARGLSDTETESLIMGQLSMAGYPVEMVKVRSNDDGTASFEFVFGEMEYQTGESDSLQIDITY